MEMRKCAPVLLGEVGVTISRHAIPSLALTMRRAYSHAIAKLEERADPGVEASMVWHILGMSGSGHGSGGCKVYMM